MNITPATNKRIHSLLSQARLMPQKANIIAGITNGRTNSSKDISQAEAVELVHYLTQQVVKTSAADLTKQQAQKMRRKIIALAHQMQWVLNGKADMQRINNWCEQYGYLHKKLNAYTLQELPKLVTQFNNLYNSFLKGI